MIRFDCGDGPCYMNCGQAKPVTEIRIGHTVSYRNGSKTFRARAYVNDRDVKHICMVALGDTVEEAETDALRYVREAYARDGLKAPDKINNVGRVRGALLDTWLF